MTDVTYMRELIAWRLALVLAPTLVTGLPLPFYFCPDVKTALK